MFRFRWAACIVALAFVLVVSMGLAVAQPEPTSLRFDIAEIPSRYAFDESRADENGMPIYGTPFITQGYIYPQGTLNGTNGVLENGEPEFPDLVLGLWICKGWTVMESMDSAGQPAAVTTQLFQFGDVEDNNVITTEGYEMMDIDVPVTRAITGGSGDHFAVRGEQEQVLLGFSDQMGVNLRVELRLAGANPVVAAAG